MCSDVAAATSHFALRLKWGKAEESEDKRGKKRVFKRCKWPGWREAAEGQFVSLMRPASWVNMSTAEADISRAGRTGGAVTRTSKRTPFDPFLHLLLATRKKEKGDRRKAAQRAILEVRRQQKQWRVEQRMVAATLAGRNLGKEQSQAQSIFLVGKESVALRKKSFEGHWSAIMCGTTQNADQPDALRSALPSGQPHPGAAPVSLEDLCSVLATLKLGRTGGADGVAAEFLQALPVEGKIALAARIRAILEGLEPAPRGWAQASVVLFPKGPQAALPG